MIELFPVPQLRLTFDDALTPPLVRVARKKAGVGMAMLFSLMLVVLMEPNDPVPVQAMDAAEMAPLTASCEAPTGPKLPVPVDVILAQVTAPLPSALNGKVLPLNTLNPPLFVARKPLLLAVTPAETTEFVLTSLAEIEVVEMPPLKVPVAPTDNVPLKDPAPLAVRLVAERF